MFLKFYKNHEKELHEYESYEKLLDPRINKYYFNAPSAPRITVRDYFDALKTIYTRENLDNNWRLLESFVDFFGSSQSYRYIYKEIIDSFPQDKLWILNFLRFAGTSNSGIQFSFYRAQPRITLDDEVFTLRIDQEYINVATNVHSFNRGTLLEEEKQSMKAVTELMFRSAIERYETLFNAHSHKIYASINSIGDNQLVQYMFKYMLNKPFATMGGNRNICVGDLLLMEDYAVSPNTNRHTCALVISTPISKTNRKELYQVFSYSHNPMNSLKWPLKVPNEHDVPLYGVELECSTDYGVQTIIDAMDELFMVAKSDSSISGSKRHRYELVTVPMSFRAHKREWAKWFSKLDYNKFDCTKDTNNGLHVHIGKKHFDNENHIRNLAWFINNPGNREFMIALSERNQYSIDNYAPMVNFGSNVTKGSAMKYTRNHVEGLRGAINLRTNKPTVEIRLFRGIVSYAAILKNLECVDAMFNFTRELPVTKMTVPSFINWLKRTPVNKYPVFKKFVFALPNIDSLIAGGEMFDLLFNIKDPEKILEKLNKNNYVITGEHVSILNKKFKKRTFVFDKRTKQIQIVQTNKFNLAHMDRELEKRYASN